MHLALDFDNVVIDSHTANITSLNMLYRTNFAPEESAVTHYTKLLGKNIAQEDSLLAELSHHTPMNARQLVPHSQASIQSLVAQGVRFTILTARGATCHPKIVNYCQLHSLIVQAVVCLDNRYESFEKKAKACEELGLDGIIDDQPMYLEACHKLDLVLLLDQPWNRQQAALPHVTRVQSWQEAHLQISTAHSAKST